MRFIHTADWQLGKPFGRFGRDEPGQCLLVDLAPGACR